MWLYNLVITCCFIYEESDPNLSMYIIIMVIAAPICQSKLDSSHRCKEGVVCGQCSVGEGQIYVHVCVYIYFYIYICVCVCVCASCICVCLLCVCVCASCICVCVCVLAVYVCVCSVCVCVCVCVSCVCVSRKGRVGRGVASFQWNV